MSDTQILIETSEKFFAIAEEHFGKKLRRPKYSFDLRGQTSGIAMSDSSEIKYNLQIFMHNQEAFLARTVPHEVAHCVSVQIYGLGALGHGKYWRHVMLVVFGRTEEQSTRTHSYSAGVEKTRKVENDWAYKCKCRTHNLSTVRHNKAQKKGVQYSCNFCRGVLSFVGKGVS